MDEGGDAWLESDDSIVPSSSGINGSFVSASCARTGVTVRHAAQRCKPLSRKHVGVDMFVCRTGIA